MKLGLFPLLVTLTPISFTVVYWTNYLLEYLAHFLEADATQITFDFIIVGGGAAGCILASRLSENPNYKVLLIEAGGKPPFFGEIPLVAFMYQKTNYDWAYETVPQDNGCFGLRNQRSLWPRGKLLGGSSEINYMFYVRGHPEDFNNWARLGNEGWSYADVLPYFKKFEDFQVERKQWAGDMYHSSNGSVTVVDSNFLSRLSSDFLDAGRQLGFPVLDDYNGPTQEGFTRVQMNLKRGVRCGAYKCILRPVLHRPNLYVMPNARAQKLLINEADMTAYGVVVKRYGQTLRLKASKEVIVSSGTLGTAQLLMLSGIGPADHLKSLNVPVVADLPVGENLQDHVTTNMGPVILNESVSVAPSSDVSIGDLWQFFSKGTGVYTTVTMAKGMAFLHSSLANTTYGEWPDIHIIMLGISMSEEYEMVIRSYGGLQDEIWHNYFTQFSDNRTLVFLPIVARPFSKGSIKLASTNPEDSVVINPAYYSDPRDLQIMLEAIRMCEKIISTKPFRDFGARMPDNPIEGCKQHRLYSDDYWKCLARHFTFTTYHPIGTCKMGSKNDPTSVVDSQLRVHNLKGLRVVDASVMPVLVNANTHATTLMIAEKAADLIKNSWERFPTAASAPWNPWNVSQQTCAPDTLTKVFTKADLSPPCDGN